MALLECIDCENKFNIGGDSELLKITECPSCGSKNLKGYVQVDDNISVHEMLKTKAREGRRVNHTGRD